MVKSSDSPVFSPGAPLPHIWLQRDTEDISTLDLCGYDRFTLITGIAGSVWANAAAQVSRETGVCIEPVAVGLGQHNNDVLGAWTRRREIAEDGCLLVRPDTRRRVALLAREPRPGRGAARGRHQDPRPPTIE